MTEFVPSPEQKAVLDRPLESFRIAAGAGTGKTTTLAYRVVELIQKHGVEPENVLGITFTNKAAEELANRVRSVLDMGLSRAVEVYTYHGFASSLLHEFGALVGFERDSRLITPSLARSLVHSVMHRLAYQSFDISAPSSTETVLRFASNLANHLVDPAEIVPPDPPDDAWLQRLELLKVVSAFQEEKQRLGVCDFNDLLVKANRLIDTHTECATSIRDRYRVVLLDEYQDTDPAQRELLRKLFAGVIPVMAVGDPDQTIYEWRGASLDNFERFPEHFAENGSPTPTLPLTLNRRSGPEILEVANRVRAKIDDTIRPPLEAVPTAPPARIRGARFGTAAEEASWIASDILAKHQQGIAWSDVAILFRKNKSMPIIQEALASQGIPFQVANLGGLLNVPEVADLFAWLRILGRPSDSAALVRILLGSRFRLGLGDLAPLAQWVRTQNRHRPQEAEDEETFDFSLLEAIDHLGEFDLRPSARSALQQFQNEYLRILETSHGSNLGDLCRTILEVTGAWSDVDAMTPSGALSARLNLHRFLDLAGSWTPLEGHSSLSVFLEYLDASQDDRADELDAASVSRSDSVTLITVHRAKGLEWGIVYIPALTERTFPSAARSLEDPYKRPDCLPHELRLDGSSLPQITADMTPEDRRELLRIPHMAQEWRIAYVGVTRARHELVATTAYWYGSPEPTKTPAKASELFDTIVDGLILEPDCPEPPPRPDNLQNSQLTNTPTDPLFPTRWPPVLRQALQDPTYPGSIALNMGGDDAYHAHVDDFRRTLFELPETPDSEIEERRSESVTGLVTYAACPKKYFWSHVDPLPRRPNTAALKGVEVHRKIELHGLGMVPLDEPEEESYDLPETETDTGTQPGDTEKGPFPDPYQVYLESRFASVKPNRVEAPFELLLPNGVWVRGRIDAIYGPDGENRWEIVDFKSGRMRPVQPIQLQAYAVAATEIGLVPADAPLSVTFAYLGGGVAAEMTLESDPDFVDQSRRELTRISEAILSGEFQPTPGDQCRSCDFLRFCDAGIQHLEKP